MLKYDAVVIGAGPGGYECAIRLAQNGKKTALVEECELGGTCLNRGCIPTKALLHSADVYDKARNADACGVFADKVTFDYAKIIQRKNAITKKLRNGVAFLEKSHGVEVIQARAVLSGTRRVSLSNGEELEAAHIVLATGSLPSALPIPGTDLPGVVDSTAALLDITCPQHIIIIGGGVIGVEFATFYSRLGVKVTILEMLDRILEPFDKELARLVSGKLEEQGVSVVVNARVESIAEGLTVRYTDRKKGAGGSVRGDLVLVAGGRQANSRGMGFEQAGLRMTRGGFVETDGLCRTNIPNIYAIGDLNGKMLLAHAASAQGLMVADLIAGIPRRAIHGNRIPSCVYCHPELAMVGMTEEKARAAGREIGTGAFNIAGNGKALAIGENEGMIKIVFDKTNGEILGCHIWGPHATDLVAEIAAVMECEGTVDELGTTVHPHPTVSEIILEAAHDCRGKSANAPAQKPR